MQTITKKVFIALKPETNVNPTCLLIEMQIFKQQVDIFFLKLKCQRNCNRI